ncbi:hypothetical protein, partial [Megasphaera massiliensis]|uniref:hypothetical protein n=2 Tax=Megasphaera TaxID=906 RepID=UPI0026EDC78D
GFHRTFELIRLFSYENDLHSRVKLGINKSKDLFTGVHSIIVQFSKVICHRRSDDLFILPNYEGLVKHSFEEFSKESTVVSVGIRGISLTTS